jgi:hypothetical protein
MNIHDIYARISLPAPPSGRVPQAFICDAIYVVFSEHRWDPKVGCLITDFRTAGRRKFIFGGQVGRPSAARRTPDRTQIIWGMCLITDFRTPGRGKFKFGGQVRETDYSTAHAGSDPNYLGDVSNHRL